MTREQHATRRAIYRQLIIRLGPPQRRPALHARVPQWLKILLMILASTAITAIGFVGSFLLSH